MFWRRKYSFWASKGNFTVWCRRLKNYRLQTALLTLIFEGIFLPYTSVEGRDYMLMHSRIDYVNGVS